MKLTYDLAATDPKSSARELKEVIQLDPPLTAKLLERPALLARMEDIPTLVQEFVRQNNQRSGKTIDGKSKLKIPTSTLSTAEAISVINNGQALAAHFGNGSLSAHDLASGLSGAIIKDATQDTEAWQEYLETVMKSRKGWGDLYTACKELG